MRGQAAAAGVSWPACGRKQTDDEAGVCARKLKGTAAKLLALGGERAHTPRGVLSPARLYRAMAWQASEQRDTRRLDWAERLARASRQRPMSAHMRVPGLALLAYLLAGDPIRPGQSVVLRSERATCLCLTHPSLLSRNERRAAVLHSTTQHCGPTRQAQTKRPKAA